jgi:hypothetical protein
MTKHPFPLLIIVLLLGWSFDFLFWRSSIGINLPIFISLSILAGLYLLISSGFKPAPNALWPILPIVIFSAFSVLRQEPLSLFLAFTFAFFSLGLLTVTYTGGRWIRYSLLDYSYKFIFLAAFLIGEPLTFLFKLRTEGPTLGNPNARRILIPMLRGLLIALPVVACLGSLFASADLIFNQKILEIRALFNLGTLLEYALRFMIIISIAYVMAGVYLHAAEQSKDEKLIGEDKPVLRPFMGFIESSMVLSSVTILFILFVLIQFRYFFGGSANIGGEGFTYSQYARRGFNELTAVASISLILVLGLSTITKRQTSFQRRSFSALSITILTLVLIILASAYQRLALAIDWHGYSRLRVYPQIFLIWVGILFAVVVILEVSRRERYFAVAAILAAMGFALSLNFFNVDSSIVSHNVMRASQGRHFNVPYLASLSTDAIPALADKFQDPALPITIHEGIGAALLCYQQSNLASEPPVYDWRSFNVSKWRMMQSLDNLSAQLQNYRVSDGNKQRPVRVRTPGNVLYECQGNDQTD